MNSNADSYGDMGGAFFLLIGVCVLIWAALKHSDSKIQNNAIQQKAAKQVQAKQAFSREFGEGQFDSNDFYLANRVVDYAKAGGEPMETIKGVAGLFGTMKRVTAQEASKATADMIKSQIEDNRQNRQEPPQIPQQPPIYIEQPREPRRRVRYIDDEPEYVYRPRPGRPYGHYDY